MPDMASAAASDRPTAASRRSGRQDDHRSARSTAGQSAKATRNRRRLTRDERREQLLDVAADLLAHGGFDSVTMERVAHEAGVSKALPYAHFDNAEDLMHALFRREMLDHGRRVVDAIEASDAPTMAGIRAFFETLEQHQVLFSMLLHPTTTPGPLRDSQLASRSDNDAYFARRYRQGLGLPEATARTAAAIMLDSLGGTVRAWTDGYASRREIERIFTVYTDGGLRALAAETNRRDGSAKRGSSSGSRSERRRRQ